MQTLLEAWHWFLERLTGGSVLVCAVVGALFLLGSALTLVYTRIGQTRPVLTCGLLSVVAHLLLLVMASRVIFLQPLGEDGGELASVGVVEMEDDADEAPPERQAEAAQPDEPNPFMESDSAANPTAAIPPLAAELPAPLPRPDHETDLVIEQEWPNQPLAETNPPRSESLPLEAPGPATEVPQLSANPSRPDELPVAEAAPPAAVEVPRMEMASADGPAELSSLEGLPDLPAWDEGRPPQLMPAIPLEPQLTDAGNALSLAPVRDVQPPPALPLPQVPAPVAEAAEDSSAQRLATAMRIRLRAAERPPVPLEYSLRVDERRSEIVARNGGSASTEAAVAAALAWLARTQEADGRWDPKRSGAGQERNLLGHDRRGAGSAADCGITALALLAFLSGGHTHEQGDYQDTVRRGLEYLRASQSADGSLAGAATLYERTYCHGMAMLALGEAVAMTGDERLRESLRRAVGWTVNAQNRIDGGWRYQPGDAGDMSQFGWQVLGLRSAMLAGVDVPRETRDGMARFLHQCTRGPARGLGSYRPGEGPSPTMTAEALVCRYLLESTPAAATRAEATGYLLGALPEESQANYYYWYYATMAMHQSGGEAWERWNTALVPVLARMQVLEGPDAGSFRADEAWSCHGGQVFSTAMATLCLEVYYRYMPVYEATRDSGSSAEPLNRQR